MRLRSRLKLGALFAALLLSAETRGAAPELVNCIAAIVNNRIITYDEVRRQVLTATENEYRTALMIARVRPQEGEREIAKLYDLALEKLQERELILHEFETGGKYQLPDAVLEEQLKDQIRRRFGDRRSMLQTLQKSGRSFESLKKEVREQFIVRAMVGTKLGAGTTISPYKIEKFYRENPKEFELQDRVRLRMIRLKNRPDRDAEATRKLAEEILVKLQAGRPFAELAAVYSDDSRSGRGDADWIDRTTYGSEVTQAAFALKPGEHSGVIQLDTGCYLLQVEEFQSAHLSTLPEVRDQIEKRLRDQEERRLQDQWLNELRKKSFLRTFIIEN